MQLNRSAASRNAGIGAQWLYIASSSRSRSLLERDLFGEPVSTHRVEARGHAFRIML